MTARDFIDRLVGGHLQGRNSATWGRKQRPRRQQV